MTATRSRVRDRWRKVDSEFESLLYSLEDAVRTLGREPERRDLGGIRALAPIPPAGAAADPVPMIDLRAAWALPSDLCRHLRMLPVGFDSDGTMMVAVDRNDVNLQVEVLRRHRDTHRTPAFRFGVVSPQDLDALIAAAHGEAALAPPKPRRALQAGSPAQLPAAPPHAPDADPISAQLPAALPRAPDADLSSPEEAPAREREPAPASTPEPLGARLVASGVITEDDLDRALLLQQRYGGKLGELLVNDIGHDETAIALGLADQLGIAFCDLDAVTLDSQLIDLVGEELIHRGRVIPLERDAGTLHVAMVDPLDEDTVAQLYGRTGLRVARAAAIETAYERAFQRAFSAEHTRRAVEALLEEHPEDSAHETFTLPQRVTAALLALVAVVGLAVSTVPTVVAMNCLAAVFYMSFALYRLRLVYFRLSHDEPNAGALRSDAELDERELPIYTILVPIYREVAVLPELIAGIAALDYPKFKLDVKLICEADDTETVAAIEQMGLPPYFRVVVVPDSQPKTKPKACNFALAQARGEMVVIFDAEDTPEPSQLRKVLAVMAEAPQELACVQAKLDYRNAEQNLLTRWFTAEYAMWFDLVLPGLEAYDAPIPLGGTSNHFRLDVLRFLGDWDPFNVTEDADLGIRLYKFGYKTRVVDSVTFEEANSVVGNWIRQRSRWIKGYMQTWLVHMRHPWLLTDELGWRGWLSFQLTIGGTFLGPLLNPVYWLMVGLWFLTSAHVIESIFPPIVYYVASINLVLWNFAFVYATAAGAARRRHFELVRAALLSPLYWVLLSIGAWKGAIQLITRPFYWEKTIHGLDRR